VLNVGRMMAVVEMIFGQLYLVTVVALVVQNLGQQSRLGRRMEEELQEKENGGPGDDAGYTTQAPGDEPERGDAGG
jgi:hypothetical protein